MGITESVVAAKGETEISIQEFNYRVALHNIAGQSPTLVGNIRTFMTFHPPDALHTLRIARTLSETAVAYGLDPLLATFAGLGHDVGKADQLRELHRESVEPDSILLLHHVAVARINLTQVPDSEISPVSKSDLMAVALKHHEILVPGGFAEPRQRQRIFLGRNRRMPVSDAVRKMQILLALCDRADRACWGLESDKWKGPDEVSDSLAKIVRKSGELTPAEKEWVKIPIGYICGKITNISEEDVVEDIKILLRFG